MKKKLLLLTVLVIALVCLFAISVSAADFKSDYTTDITEIGTGPDWADLTDANATAVIKKADGTTVRIPAYYIVKAGKTFYTNGTNMDFAWITDKLGEEIKVANLVALDIPSDFTSINGSISGTNLPALEELVIPTSITSLGQSMFRNNTVIKKVFVKQTRDAEGNVQGVTTLPAYLADITNGSTSALEEFNFELDYLTAIGQQAFQNSAIRSFTITAPITSIGSTILGGCKLLETVYINNTGEIISTSSLFNGATNISSVTLNGLSLGGYTLQNANALTNANGTFIATNVGSISSEAFKNANNFTTFEFSGPITSIGNNIFTGTSSIVNVKIINTGEKSATCGENLLSCGDKATDKPAIKSVTLHNIDLGYRALYNLKNDGVKISVTGNYTSIGYQALSGAAITEITIPASVTSLGQNAFYNCKALKSVVFENVGTEMSIGNDSFKSCSALETVKFNKNAGIKYLGVFMFYECKALKYLSIPDSVTTLKTSAFYNCDALGPVYLPKNLATIEKIDSLFEGCENMYFVNEFFEDPTKVEKPSVYYFPNIITEIPKDHEMFKLCANLNETIVFGDKLTAVKDGFAFGKYDSKAPTTNYVFLGNVTDFAYYGGYFYNTNLYFCNPNTTVESINIYVYNSSSSSTNCNVYICASGVWSDLKTRTFENTMAKTNHLQEKIVETPATCILNEGTHKLCFCGFVMESTDKEGGQKALGHTSEGATAVVYFPLLNGAPNYFANAHEKYNCTRCLEEQDNVISDSALFVGDRGYSYEEEGTSVLYRLHVNVDNIKAYSDTFKYGIVVSGAPSTAPITLVDGKITYGNKTLVFEMQNVDYEFSFIQAKVTNIGTAELNCQAYAIDNTVVTYIGHNNVNTLAEIVTYDAIVSTYGTTGEAKEN